LLQDNRGPGGTKNWKEVQENEMNGKVKTRSDVGIVDINQPFFTLEQAWVIKGAVYAWNTFRQNHFIQPKGGLFDGYVGGVGIFTKETIREWLHLMDEEMEAYNLKWKTGAKPKIRIKRGRQFNEDTSQLPGERYRKTAMQ
jgi:hypothetical protein